MQLSRRSALALPALLLATRGVRAAEVPIAVRIQGAGNVANTVPDMLARTSGIFARNGLAVEELPPIYNAGAILQAVVQGAADIAYGGGSSIIQAVQQGRPVKVVGSVMRTLELKVSLTRPGLAKAAAAGVTPASPFAQRVAVLKGMRLAAPATGSTSDLAFRYSLKRNGVDPSRDVQVQPMSDLVAMVAAARQGVVDGLVGVAATANGRAEAEGSATRFIAFEDEDPVLRIYPTYILAVSDAYLKANREAVRRVVLSFAQAQQAIKRGLTPEERAAIKQQFFPDMAQPAFDYSLGISLPALGGPITPTPEQFQALLTVNNTVADMPAQLTQAQVFDTSVADEVVRSL